MSRNMIQRLLGVMLAAATALTFTACSGIPRSSGVNQGSVILPVEDDAVEFLPAGPLQDGTIEQILRGFVEASSSPVSDYAIARQFLTPEFSAQWDASAVVNVDAGIRSISQISESQAQLSFSLSAQVGSQGNYEEITPTQTTIFDYSFELVAGQWRISQAPNGVVIDRFTFNQVYQSRSLYFFDSTSTWLIPDVRFFPGGASASTRIARAVLAGPSSWLASNGAVQTSFPEGTALVADSVPVTRGVATVDLNTVALTADPAVMKRMKQQLSASLQSVPGINSVVVLVEGAVLGNAISDSIVDVMPPTAESYPAVLTAGSFGYWSGSRIQPLATLASILVPAQPRAISLSSTSTIAAMLTGEGVSLIRNDVAQLVDARSGLIAPQVDNFGYVWSVPAQRPAQLQVFSTDGRVTEVETPWSNEGTIRALEISRDGTQVLVLLEVAGKYQLAVSALVRGERATPVALGPLFTQPLGEGTPEVIAWVDGVSFAVVSQTASGEHAVRLHEVGGETVELSSITEGTPIAMAGANTIAGLRVLLSTGVLLALRSGAQWQETMTDAVTLATQQ